MGSHRFGVPNPLSALLKMPTTLHHLAKYGRAVEVVSQVLEEVRTRTPERIPSAPKPQRTPLTDEQRAISASVDVKRGGDRQPRPKDATDDASYLRQLYEQAYGPGKWKPGTEPEGAQGELNQIVREIAAQTKGEAGFRSGPKNERRAWDKIATEYEGDVSQLNDLAGAKIEFDTLADLYAALHVIASHPDVNIVRFKDRFEKPQQSGYRDIQMFLRMKNNHIAEFRLHLRSVDDVAAWEHALYEVRRDLTALADRRGKELDVPERAIQQAMLAVEQRLFWEALQGALPRNTKEMEP